MTVPVRAALYCGSRPAGRRPTISPSRTKCRQASAYCASRDWEVVADYVEPSVSSTDDKRPEFQRMVDAVAIKPPGFDVIPVHSFSRFFRDQFRLEFHVRQLAK